MRLVSYQARSGARVAGVRDGQIVDLNQADPEVPASAKVLLAQGPEGLRRAEAALASGQPVHRSTVKLLPPIPDAQKIFCCGGNYAEHVEECDHEVPSEPVIFAKLPTTLRADGDPVVLPRLSTQVDYEAELVVVIGRGGRYIPEDEAMNHVAGYCCGNDVSARDWQLGKPGGQWLLGKSFDSFGPIGPELVTVDEIPDPNHLGIRLRLNGQVMQESNTELFLFSIARLIHYVSGVATLLPGDLLFTGTPSGVGFARKPPVLLKPGDQMEVEIDQIGVLRNPVTAE